MEDVILGSKVNPRSRSETWKVVSIFAGDHNGGRHFWIKDHPAVKFLILGGEISVCWGS